MNKKIWGAIILLLIGAVAGFWLVVNWQLYQETKKTAQAMAGDSQRLDLVEKYIKDNLLSANNNQQK